MLEWLSNIGKKADHPMHNAAAAEKLLAELPADNGKALEEITSSLETVTATPGFAPADRIGVVKLLDETGQKRERAALLDFVRSPTLKEFDRLRLWRASVEFWERLAPAYRLCLQEIGSAAKPGSDAHKERVLLAVRALRAVASAAKALYLRYLPVTPQVWQALSELYGQSEKENIAGQSLKAYANDPVVTGARQEFLRALMLDASIPESAQLHEVELSARIIARLASGFIMSETPEPGCNFCFDLAQPGRPVRRSPEAPAAHTMRYFGAGRTVAAIQETIERHAANPEEPEKRFGDEFSVQEKLIVLKRLLLHWGDAPLRRRGPRVTMKAPIKVAHGLKAASELVTRVEFAGMAEVTTNLRMKIKEQTGITVEAQEMTAEIHDWVERDASAWGIGADVPRKDESWARIGTICTFQPAGLKTWWVGVIRRLDRDQQDQVHAGIEVVARRPLSVYLRGIGKGAQRADNWASSSGSFEYTFAAAVILGEGAMSGARTDMLIARDTFTPGLIFELMVGEKSPTVRLDELLERADDYDHVRITWLKRGA